MFILQQLKAIKVPRLHNPEKTMKFKNGHFNKWTNNHATNIIKAKDRAIYSKIRDSNKTCHMASELIYNYYLHISYFVNKNTLFRRQKKTLIVINIKAL